MKHRSVNREITLSSFISKYFFYITTGVTLLALILIWVNFRQLLYFTWDQGRDYFAIMKIVSGDQTLIGPTTGLHGFFLGPFWFYLGVPGYLLADGSPLGLSIWYVFVASLALPVIYYLARELAEGNQLDHLLLFSLLILSPASINGITKIWNPMIGIALMGLFFSLMVDHRYSKVGQTGLAFLLLGLSLQAEFAYAVFFVPMGFLMIWPLANKEKWKHFLVGTCALGLTLVPQVLFELRNDLVMTKTLINHILYADDIAWSALWLKRPLDLIISTKTILVGNNAVFWGWGMFAILMLLFIIGVCTVLKQDSKDTRRRPIVYFAIMPYLMYMFWKGNHGNFFDYYLTAHYLVVLPVVYWGLQTVVSWKIKSNENRGKAIVLLTTGIIIYGLIPIVNYRVFSHENNAGFLKMNQAVGQIYAWIQEDGQSPGVVKIFTPNTNTEHYDALFLDQSRFKNQSLPLTVADDQTTRWYTLIEPDHQLKTRLSNWRQLHTDRGDLIRSSQIGALTVETWQIKPTMTSANPL